MKKTRFPCPLPNTDARNYNYFSNAIPLPFACFLFGRRSLNFSFRGCTRPPSFSSRGIGTFPFLNLLRTPPPPPCPPCPRRTARGSSIFQTRHRPNIFPKAVSKILVLVPPRRKRREASSSLGSRRSLLLGGRGSGRGGRWSCRLSYRVLAGGGPCCTAFAL